ncbi:Uncharacterized protein conserved in bacteria [Klebsiella pneumoniae]|uniref:Uncharacterized protein conserved in bacteria n=1 Tax=Klebsiella pneumoniae TaxID=573 RepID=A0A377ZQZ2_KLEPN|nr:Uncharacterized protein conserved in bacteria [Klebsiella pneumoniae]
MLFSSRDAQHYQPGQGTQLLQEIAQMLPGLLERWIETRMTDSPLFSAVARFLRHLGVDASSARSRY